MYAQPDFSDLTGRAARSAVHDDHVVDRRRATATEGIELNHISRQRKEENLRRSRASDIVFTCDGDCN